CTVPRCSELAQHRCQAAEDSVARVPLARNSPGENAPSPPLQAAFLLPYLRWRFSLQPILRRCEGHRGPHDVLASGAPLPLSNLRCARAFRSIAGPRQHGTQQIAASAHKPCGHASNLPALRTQYRDSRKVQDPSCLAPELAPAVPCFPDIEEARRPTARETLQE